MYSGEKVLVGLEHGKAADYAMRLNLAAQINLVDGALPRRALEKQLFLQPAILRTFIEPDHLRRWHSKMARQFKSQLPGLGFQQRP